MTKLLVHLLVSALLLWLVSRIVHGIHIADFGYAVLAALVLGLVNFLIRPILIIVTLPITIVTLGLFLFVINGITVWLVAHLVHGVHIHGLWHSILAALVISLTSWAASSVINAQSR
jgi:putative membrane protein